MMLKSFCYGKIDVKASGHCARVSSVVIIFYFIFVRFNLVSLNIKTSFYINIRRNTGFLDLS